jgi:hypothetical protein
MFSGQTPFHGIHSDYSIPLAVRGGKRPSRPVCDLSQTRGLTDDIWRLMETCWVQHPAKRPAANSILNDLRALPNRPTDTRLPDNVTSPSGVLSTHDPAEHPFGALLDSPRDDFRMQELKHISINIPCKND